MRPESGPRTGLRALGRGALAGALGAALLLGAQTLLPGVVPALAQDPFRPTPGRFQPAHAAGKVACLDTYTGRLHLAPAGEAAEGKAWVVDLDAALAWERPFGRDVSAGHVIPPVVPVSGLGAGGPVFAFEETPDGPGAIDTRSGKVHVLVGELGRDARVVTTDLRTNGRSVRPLRPASDAGGGGR